MRLFIDGHAMRRGYAIGIEYSALEVGALPALVEPEPPVRWVQNRRRALRLVERFNRMAARRGA